MLAAWSASARRIIGRLRLPNRSHRSTRRYAGWLRVRDEPLPRPVLIRALAAYPILRLPAADRDADADRTAIDEERPLPARQLVPIEKRGAAQRQANRGRFPPAPAERDTGGQPGDRRRRRSPRRAGACRGSGCRHASIRETARAAPRRDRRPAARPAASIRAAASVRPRGLRARMWIAPVAK